MHHRSTSVRVGKAVTMQYSTMQMWDEHLRKEVITRLDSIMYGFFGAFLMFYKYPIWSRSRNAFFALGIMLLLANNIGFLAHNMFYVNYFSLTLQSFATLLLLPKLYSIKSGPPIATTIFTFISILSYSIYLVNRSIIDIILPAVFKFTGFDQQAGLAHGLVAYVSFYVLSIAISYCLYHLYEKRMTNLRERFSHTQPDS